MKKLIIPLLLLACTPALALKEHYGLSRSIRALGMGGAFYALSDDEYALFYNPAGLSVYRGDGQFMLSFNAHASPKLLSAIKTVTDTKDATASTIADKLTEFQGTPLYGGATPFFPYYLHKNFAIGLLVADTKVDFALLGRDLDTTVDITAITDSGLFVGYGTDFLDETLHVGVNAKAVARGGGKKIFSVVDIAQSQDLDLDPKTLGGAGAGVDLDLGSTYELPDIPFATLHRASLVFNNLLASDMPFGRQGNNPPGLARTVSLGYYAVFPGVGIIDNFHALLDLAEFRLGGEEDPDYGAPTGSFWKHVNVGVEVPMGGWFIPRLGVHQGYLTAGFGVNARILRLDFATYEEELSSSPGRLGSRRFALRLQLGWGSAGPKPIIYSARTRTASKVSPTVTPPTDPTLTPPTPEKKPEPAVKPEAEEKKPLAPGEKPGEKQGDTMLDPKARVPQGEAPAATPTKEGISPPFEGNAKDRFGVDKLVEEQPSVEGREPNSETIPRSEGNAKDRFGIDSGSTP